MQTFSQHLVQLVLEDLVDLETAAAAATNRHDFEIAVQQALRRQQAAASNGAPPEAPSLQKSRRTRTASAFDSPPRANEAHRRSARGAGCACAHRRRSLRAGLHVVTPPDTPSVRVPSHTVPNAANSLKLPSPLDQPPAVPAVRSYEELLELWHRAAAYGVPWDVLAAINKIESNFGQNMGPSYAGALGWMQFIPSSWLRWGMDADGDGIADPWNPDDAVFAAARYLAAAGAHESLSRAIFAYNHAQWYVDDVLRLARVFRKSDSVSPSASSPSRRRRATCWPPPTSRRDWPPPVAR